MAVSNFKFGVEIELGAELEDIDDNVNMPDGWRSHAEHCGSEIVSPILSGYSGLMSVRNMIHEIHSAFDGQEIDLTNCGFHVHVDVQDFTLRDMKRLMLLASRFECVIFAMLPVTRRHNRYARTIRMSEEEIMEAKTFISLFDDAGTRHRGLNIQAFMKHGTVEFRYAQSTLSWRTVYALTTMYLRMVAFAKSNKQIPSPNGRRWVAPGNMRRGIELLNAKFRIFLDAIECVGNVKGILMEQYSKNKMNIRGPKTYSELVGGDTFLAGLRRE